MPGTDDLHRWLLSDAGRSALAETEALHGTALARAAAVRAKHSADRVHVLLECAELRRRARAKFDRADRMFFTEGSMEAATSQAVARHKAIRFRGSRRIADICCGIGGDQLALAAEAHTVGVDAEHHRLLYARENCRVYEVDARAAWVRADAERFEFGIDAVDAVHIDPDWRLADRRNSDPQQYRPSQAAVESWIAKVPDAAVKISSGADFASLGWDCEIELISEAGECKQAVCWFGRFREGSRTATLLPSGRRLVHRDRPDPPVAPVGRWLFEPDPAVIRAGLIEVLAADHGLAVLDRRVAYLTGDAPIRDPALSAFEVLRVLPWDRRRVREAMRELRIGRVEVKKRAVEVDPDALARELSNPDRGEPATLLLTRVGDRRLAIIARRPVATAG